MGFSLKTTGKALSLLLYLRLILKRIKKKEIAIEENNVLYLFNSPSFLSAFQELSLLDSITVYHQSLGNGGLVGNVRA